VQVPLAIHRAHAGDYGLLAQLAVQRQRNLRGILSLGMLLCVTCAEDVARIDPEEVEAATAGTLTGSGRVLDQMRVCAFWPQGDIPDDYGEPVRCEAPTLLISGSLDPVTPPEWGEEAARHLANSLHVVVPGWHGVGGPCVQAIQRAFLESGSVQGLDTDCVSGMKLPPFVVPAREPR
jgi:pimeloyl-ACP methyl ester carboxylesterase